MGYLNAYLPLLDSWLAHAESPASSVHTPSYHEPIARLKDVQGAGHPGVRHRAHKDGELLRFIDTNSEIRKSWGKIIQLLKEDKESRGG